MTLRASDSRAIMALANYAQPRSDDRGFVIGGSMAAEATTRPTLSEIDEALFWSSTSTSRDDHWQRWIDALLDKRNDITQGGGPTHVSESI